MVLVFLETEFTSFVRPDLISIGLVAEYGREFYAERTDYRRDECSDFVCETVLPLLGRVPGAACSRPPAAKHCSELESIRFSDGVQGALKFELTHLTGVFEVLKPPVAS